jgi:LysW-gamma-L-lysine carboxypeptidase
MSTTEMTAAGNPISEEYAVDLLRRMLAIPSPSYQEQELAEFLAQELNDLGFAARIDDAGNVIGQIGADNASPAIMLLGHIDTVPGDIPLRTDSGRIYGRGSVDAKGPMAAMICAARLAAGAGVRLTVVGAVEEETSLSRGATLIRDVLPVPDAVIIGEPSGWSNVVLGYKGKLDIYYEVECEPTHPTNPVPKATELAGRCWATLLELLGPDASHESFDQPGANLLSIAGDMLRAEAEFSVRTPPGFDEEHFVNELRMRTPRGRLSVISAVAAFRVGRTDPVVQALSAAIRGHGVRPGTRLKTGTADLNILAEKWQVPAATYGPGDSNLDHSANESADITEYLRGISVLTDALRRLRTLLADGTAGPAARQPTAARRLDVPPRREPDIPDPVHQELAERATRIRERIVRMCAGSSGGHLGGSMSLVEILVTLYSRVLNVDPAHPDADDRDMLILSKGHGAIGLYAALGEYGFFSSEQLNQYGKAGSPFMAHPNSRLPGVEMPSGALGHGLPLAIGFALAARLDGSRRRSVVIMGDGELQEGSVWEGAMAASSLGLQNLTAVVDRNNLQITGGTEDVIRLEPLTDRWRSFGWTVRESDGHDLAALHAAFTVLPEAGKPTVIIANTVKGRGLPFLENDVRSHFVNFSDRQEGRAMAALHRDPITPQAKAGPTT